MDAFAQRLRAAMLAAGYTGAELARESEISPVTISRLLNGHSQNPHNSTIHQLARVLSVHPAELLGITVK